MSRIKEMFGSMVFNDSVMKDKLPHADYKALKRTIQSGRELDPDIAVAVDVSFAYSLSEDENKCGYLGKGPMIGISPSLDKELSDELINTAKKSDIPYQTEVMNGLTSTNADQYSVSRCGARTCTVSIPLRNMHTPAEVIDIRDVELTARLLAEFIKEGN